MHRNNVILGGGHEIAQLADWDEETITTVIAAVLGIGDDVIARPLDASYNEASA